MQHRSTDQALREHVVALLAGNQAHCTLDDALAGLPAEARGRQTERLPWTVWQLLEHIRIAQHDILEYCRDRNWQSPAWPDEYWPDRDLPADDATWHQSVQSCRDALDAMRDLVRDESNDLFAEVRSGTGHTLLREALLVADHNAYHIGQIIAVRRAIGTWKD